MPPAKYRQFLLALGTDRSGHTGRSLMDHLIGTYDILQSWDAPHHVCLAGLFHSVYGTVIYKTRSIALESRDIVRDEIGGRAERLAYAFCVTGRPDAFLRAIGSDPAILFDQAANADLRVSRAELSELLEIECANLLEQHLGMGFLRSLARAAADTPGLLSVAAATAIARTLAVTQPRTR